MSTATNSIPGQIRSHVDQGVGWIVIDNPRKHNAMSLAMWRQLTEALAGLAQDSAVRCVVIRGEGERAFCAGADIDEKQGASVEQSARDQKLPVAGMASLAEYPKPTIAMISGYCLGGGLAVALACRMRFASSSSVLGVPAAKLGIAYLYPSLKRLTELVGPAWTRQMLFTADRLTAQQAERIGLVNEVVEPERLLEHVTSLAGRIAANAPLSIAAAEYAIALAISDPPGRDLSGCEAHVRACMASEDFVEGRRAFQEKRAPVFRGR